MDGISKMSCYNFFIMSVKNKSKNYFSSVDPKVSFPDMESNILNFWEKNSVYKKSIEKTQHGPLFNFYEGPPTANGKT